ncbi:MAG: GntR family transcriptional regulator [Victivallaceae bacterium]
MFDDVNIKTMALNPIYQQIADILKKNIISGKLPTGTKLPPEELLSVKFNTSRMTLRKSLRILEQQNLLVQRHGRGTFVTYKTTPKKNRIALITGRDIHKIYDPYIFRILSGLNVALQANTGSELLLLDMDKNETIIRKFHSSNSDGLICLDDSAHVKEELFKPEFANIPMVFMNWRSFPEDKNLLEYAARVVSRPGAVETAVAHLTGLGHRRIGYIAAPASFSDLKLRNEEFLNARSKYGLDADESLYREYFSHSNIRWYDQAREIARDLCSSSNRPSAILCPNACNAYGAWQGIMDCKLRIPEDISIIGFDCESYFNPYLSTMSQPVVEMAEAAAGLIVKILDNGKLTEKELTFDFQLEERGSCAILNKHKSK